MKPAFLLILPLLGIFLLGSCVQHTVHDAQDDMLIHADEEIGRMD